MVKAVKVNEFGTPTQSLSFVEDWNIPPREKGEALIKIAATSISPIDARMRSGYGKNLFTTQAALPWVLGRDFSGTIEEIDDNNPRGLKVGDEVIGVSNPFAPKTLMSGAHCEKTIVPISDIVKKPKNIDLIEAASLPYVALTVYSALITTSGLNIEYYKNKEVMVTTGAGGIGSYAIQFLKALGARVTATCSTQNIDFVKSLGADFVIDYTKEDIYAAKGKFDVCFDMIAKYTEQEVFSHIKNCLSLLKQNIPDASKQKDIEELKNSTVPLLQKIHEEDGFMEYIHLHESFSGKLNALIPFESYPTYVSIVGPSIFLTDKLGLKNGLHKYIELLIELKATFAKQGYRFYYSVFDADETALNLLASHISEGKVKGLVRKTYPLSEAVHAHEDIETGHGKGKIVLVL